MICTSESDRGTRKYSFGKKGDVITMSDKKVLIPLQLINQTLEFLRYIDVSEYDFSIRCEYDNIVDAFREKLRSLDLRESYAKIIMAKTEDERDNARIEYLRGRNSLY
jgi:hypothetical protein